MRLFSRDWLVRPEGAEAEHLLRIRGAQVRSITNLAPVMIVANLVMVALFVWMYWGQGPTLAKSVWVIAVLSTLSIYGVSWMVNRRERARHLRGEHVAAKTVTNSSIINIHIHAFSHGLVWGIAAPFFSLTGEAELKTVLAVGLTSVMLVGGVGLAAMPTAVIAFVVPMALGCFLAIAAEPFSLGSVALVFVLFWMAIATPTIARTYAQLFASHVATMESAKDQKAIVSMLLSELQQNSSDWIWETDAEGKLLRFPDDMLPEGGTLGAINFSDYITRIATIKGTQLETFQSALAEHRSFNDVVLCTNQGHGERWLKLSGHPVNDEDGNVRRFLGTGSDVTSEKLAEDRINVLSHSDTLTGLMNRSAFTDRLGQAVANLERYGRPFTILYLDLDDFKLINDTRGHLLGDRLLAEAAERIQDEVREVDCLARFSGDEFVILMDSQGDAGAAARLAARLIGEVSKPYLFDNEELRVGLSIGIAMAPVNGTRPEQLLRNADLALYRAKADGRGVFRFFENNMDSELRERRMLEAELRDAVANDELILHFQPLVDAKTRKTVGFESLIRWEHPIRGLLSPIEFIELAEHSNLICEMGTWTLNKACSTAANWPGERSVAVNLSAHHFMQSDIVREVAQALELSGISASRLELEITESLLINNAQTVNAKLEELKKLGVSVAMDDFGTGYSSLSYLMTVPFDKLKIDKSFVDVVETNEAGQKIVKMITKLAEELELQITAEGVEHETQAKFLEAAGCDILQGYLFSKPLPENVLPDYFAKEDGTAKRREKQSGIAVAKRGQNAA